MVAQEPLKFRLTMVHSCGHQFQMNTVETPPLLIICTGCSEILVLNQNSYDDGPKYLARGDYWDRVEEDD